MSEDGFSGRYSCDKVGWYGGWRGRPKFEYQNCLADPLTCTLDRIIYRTDNHFFTDKGSTGRLLPLLVPAWFDRAKYEKSFSFHDSAYSNGGVWVAVNGGWEFKKITRKQADEMLRDMILLEGGSKSNARLIYWGVRAGGWASWRGSDR
jgi:hypothetical protein